MQSAMDDLGEAPIQEPEQVPEEEKRQAQAQGEAIEQGAGATEAPGDAAQGNGAADGPSSPRVPPSEQPADSSTPAALVQSAHADRIAHSQSTGPSSEDRLGKSQQDIGIEDGIPTTAGAGTTMPVDGCAQEAARAGAERRQAHVPKDYEEVSCPDEIEGVGRSGGGSGGGKGGGAGGQGTSQRSSSSTTDSNDDTAAASANSTSTSSNDRSLGQKIKDATRGEAKVIGGALKRDQERVQEGKAIRRGEA